MPEICSLATPPRLPRPFAGLDRERSAAGWWLVAGGSQRCSAEEPEATALWAASRWGASPTAPFLSLVYLCGRKLWANVASFLKRFREGEPRSPAGGRVVSDYQRW